MPYSLVLHQSYCCKVKYSDKQIGFTHGNLYNLHLLSNSSPAKTWLSTRNRIFFRIDRYHSDGPSSSESKEPRFRLLEIEANAAIYIHPKFSNELGFWHRQPKLVCCEATRLRSKYSLRPSLLTPSVYVVLNVKITPNFSRLKSILVCYQLKNHLYCTKERLLNLRELKFHLCILKRYCVTKF